MAKPSRTARGPPNSFLFGEPNCPFTPAIPRCSTAFLTNWSGKVRSLSDLNRKAVAVEPPRDLSHGDLATNAAMVLAKGAGTNPRALAELIKPKLEAIPGVTHVDIAGPGFINLRLAEHAWRNELITILCGRRTLRPVERRK